jgi:hypothetical protein
MNVVIRIANDHVFCEADASWTRSRAADQEAAIVDDLDDAQRRNPVDGVRVVSGVG